VKLSLKKDSCSFKEEALLQAKKYGVPKSTKDLGIVAEGVLYNGCT
jgi:hypothetical protein